MRSVYQTRRGLDPLHLPDHAVRVDLLYGARAAEPRDLLFAQLPARGAEVVLQLLHASGANDRGRNALLPQEPVEGDLGVGLAGLLGDPGYRIQRAPVALDVALVPGLLELVGDARYARALGRLLAAPVLADQPRGAQPSVFHATPLRAVEGSTLAPQDRKVARRGPAWYDRDDRDLEGGRCRHRRLAGCALRAGYVLPSWWRWLAGLWASSSTPRSRRARRCATARRARSTTRR